MTPGVTQGTPTILPHPVMPQEGRKRAKEEEEASEMDSVFTCKGVYCNKCNFLANEPF
jgi:hypothetical protein